MEIELQVQYYELLMIMMLTSHSQQPYTCFRFENAVDKYTYNTKNEMGYTVDDLVVDDCVK